MIEFKETITASQYVVPALCSGILFMGILLYAFIYYSSRERIHATMLFLGITGWGFVTGELMVLTMGWHLDPAAGMGFHRMEQIFATLFIPAMPLMVSGLLQLNPSWQKVNRVLIYCTFIVAGVLIIISLASPDLFVSQHIHRKDWLLRQADHGRGQEGALYPVRDALLALFILYTIACFITDMVKNRRLRYLMPSFIGLAIAVYGAVLDVMSVYTGNFYDFLPESRFSRFVMGITFFILFSMGGVLRKFLDMAGEVERAHKIARDEAETSSRQNDFIKNILSSNSQELYAFSESLSSSISTFTQNTQDQAAATEEVSASIEEINANMDLVRDNVDGQFSSIEDLSASMTRLSDMIRAMDSTVTEALSAIGSVSENARTGEQALVAMEESMRTINNSSDEIMGIITIINDISDRINLLALNASIEAARAGDAGRGFAVVADEISKLADQTAESIKNIDALIKTNRSEISHGSGTISTAVERINLIISDIDVIVEKISSISGEMETQTEANRAMNEGTAMVRTMSEQILHAMNEQKAALDEISRTVGSINELAQGNTRTSMGISESSGSLADKVKQMNLRIAGFGEDQEDNFEKADPEGA